MPIDIHVRRQSPSSLLEGTMMAYPLHWPTICVALLLMLGVSGSTQAQTPTGAPLTEPPQLCPVGGVLDVGLDLKLVHQPVQVVSTATSTITAQPLPLRAYNLVDGPGWQYCDGQKRAIQNPMIPGPTFRLRKGAQGQTDGDQLRMTLRNLLPVTTDPHACNPVRNYTVTVPPRNDGTCHLEDFPLVAQQFPACLHGDNVTNMHYHGFHISPQPPQDFVLLSLYPEGTQHVTPSLTDAVGTYRFQLDPLPYTQAEGTHWYHPHKHGSTALQVTNGMAGSVIITGPFDDWLNGLYAQSGGLDDKVLIIQQIAAELNFFAQFPPPTVTKDCSTNPCVCKATPNSVPAQPSINGQLNPVLTMRPGEIQRWRLINATVQGGGQLKIGFDPQFGIKQIAQDGVQFSQQNYQQQPLLSLAWFVPDQPPQLLTNVNLAPGNRADYLVKAPLVIERTCFAQVQSVTGNVDSSVRRRIDARNQAARAALRARQGPPPLLTVCVDPALGPKPMAFPDPTQWPPMPYFLQNIPSSPVPTTVAFSMEGTQPADPTNTFLIDGVQYCPDCANHTLTLNVPQEWIITNDSAPQHPFHMHTNPHQLVEQGSLINGQPVPFQSYTSPLWEDTIALPSQGNCWNLAAGPIWDNNDAQQKCPQVCTARDTTWNGQWVTTQPGQRSVCNCCAPSSSLGYVRIRQLPIDFTGELVLHCHILGHEDRGMMQNVQIVCPQGPYWGNPRPGQPECVQGNFIPAAKQCPTTYKTGPMCASGS
jgi:FtsP/CotA-like multicopper oxidase with cupredoxin domain